MRPLRRTRFAVINAIGCGIVAAGMYGVLFHSVLQMAFGLCLSAPLGYWFSRWKLRRMGLPPDCTWDEFFTLTEDRRWRWFRR